ncbi:MAG: LTA synthase family protein [Lachnospiraceae bacterium]|nr:LTA synthase family protein [Lachnospiraceae bacterium]
MLFIVLAISLVFMEIIYHIGVAGLQGMNPLLAFPIVILVAGIECLLITIGKRITNKVVLWVIQAVNFLIFASQLIYMRIFTQPLLMAAAINAGESALTNYWRELLYAIWQNALWLILLALPLIATGILLHKKVIELEAHKKSRIWGGATTGAGILTTILVLVIGYFAGFSYYVDYQEYYDPKYIIEEFGVLASVQRDLMGDVLLEKEIALVSVDSKVEEDISEAESSIETQAVEESAAFASEEAAEVMTEEETEVVPEPVILQNVLDIDFTKLNELATDKDVSKLVAYMEARTPSNQNEYTGMFEGYNLIYLTAEGFSTYAMTEELTPTLYKMANTGFVANNYYVPLWQTSTSDGEYVNLTGQIPYKQFSMTKTAENEQPYSLPAYFTKEGVKSYAYHNNSLSYYDRHLSHPNLGYDFKAVKLGELSQAEWGSQIFEMEGAKQWPSSDFNMIKATLPEYINNDRFHVYYMTISGHMNYNFIGNSMSMKNKDAVANLPYSEEGRAYIACNIELDKALEYLIAELEKAGKLDNTVIALSADHYPYAMNIDSYEELAGKELENTLDLYRNTLIIWNSQMQEPIMIDKACGAMDLLPTLYNLFGFEYDSRLFAGTDMLSDSEGLVVFSNRSFITDKVSYNKATGEVISMTEEEVSPEYVDTMKQVVKQLCDYSAGILNHDFFRYVEQARIQEEIAENP